MAILDILIYPDDRLHKVAQPVDEVDDHIRQIIDDMFETMYAAPGIGLAATQVDIHLQIIVIDVSPTRDQPLVLINPEIIESSGEIICEEGCLSVPDIREKVSRANHIVVEYLDREGVSQRLEADDFFAVCIQHEIDHLRGIVFVEKLSRLKQTRIRIKLKKAGKRD